MWPAGLTGLRYLPLVSRLRLPEDPSIQIAVSSRCSSCGGIRSRVVAALRGLGRPSRAAAAAAASCASRTSTTSSIAAGIPLLGVRRGSL